MFAPRTNGPAKIILNTWLSGSIAGIVAVYIKPQILGTYSFVNRFDCVTLCNGILCGLVGITGCCDQVEPWCALIIGIVAAFFYMLGCWLIIDKLRVDDAVEASPIHLMGGMWGTIATALFSNENGVFFPNSPARVYTSGYFFGI
jgi:Amt family ammonium transporter